MIVNNLLMANNFILLAGSISKSTENELIDRAHAFVEIFVEEVLSAGGGFVIYVSEEPVNSDQKPLIFDWTVARTVDKLTAQKTAPVRLKIVASNERFMTKLDSEQRRLINGMIARGVAELAPLEEETLTGGNVGDEQIEHADAMVALGGGKGVLDRARKMSKKSLPVLPLDLQLGANSEDGTGALGIYKSFQSSPLTYMPHTGTQVIRTWSGLSLQDPVLELPNIANGIVRILHEEKLARTAALPPDVLILTALDIELAAARHALGISDDMPPIITNTGIHVWKAAVTRSDGTSVRCAVACFAGAGNNDASAVTATLLSELKPGIVMMLGIAGGLRKKCSLGEVFLVERVVAYESAAFLADGVVEPRPEISRVSMRVRQDMTGYLSSRHSLELRLAKRYESLGIVFPEMSKAGPIAKNVMPKTTTTASGEKLFRDPEKFRTQREIHGKIEIVEMEAAGLFAACNSHNKHVLMIRGVSDFGDTKKDNSFHDLAAKAAAAVTVDYIAHGLTIL